jgi:hypothetical protein
MERRFRTAMARDPEGMTTKYKATFGNVLNADNAKELSEDYQKNRTDGAAAVHEPASWLMKKMFAEELAKPAPMGKTNEVLFTAGGAGAGKTSSIKSHPTQTEILNRAQIVFDGTMRPAVSAIKKVDQVLAAGKSVHIIYTHREPGDAFTSGVLHRATDQEKALGSGRTVPLAEFAAQHSSVQDSMKQLREKYKNDPRVEMTVMDNSHGHGNSRKADLEALPGAPDRDTLKTHLQGLLEKAHDSGAISDRIYKATKGHGGGYEVGM